MYILPYCGTSEEKMSIWISKLKELCHQHQNLDDAAIMSSYMKNHFGFYGIKTPKRKELVKQVHKELDFPKEEDWPMLARQAFTGDHHREIQYAIGDLLRPKANKLPLSFLPVIEELIQIKSWWDTVDWLSPTLAGGILLRHPEQCAEYPDRWITSNNKWLVRSAILYQLKYKSNVDTQRLESYCLRHKDSKEFFIQKGMGWMLREYSKRNPSWVQHFFRSHNLPSLTIREGAKYIDL